MFKITSLKILDLIVGSFLCFILPALKKHYPDSISRSAKRVLFIRPGGLGDFILLIPIIQKFQKEYPKAQIDILCEKRNHQASSFLEDIRTIYMYDNSFDLINCIKNKYDIVIDTEQWHRLSAVTAFLSNAPVRIGFSTNSRKKLLTHKIPYNHEEYETQSFLNLLRPFKNTNLSSFPDSPFIKIKNELFNRTKLDHKKPIISIAPGASVPERIWNIDKYIELSDQLIRNGYTIVLIGSAHDKKITKTIKDQIPACIDITGKTDLTETAMYLKNSKVLLSPDSGIMHLAYALNTPTISLFGAGIEKKWAPPGETHIAINKHIPCSPCTNFGYTKRCKHKIKCLEKISVSEVFKALETLLQRSF